MRRSTQAIATGFRALRRSAQSGRCFNSVQGPRQLPKKQLNHLLHMKQNTIMRLTNSTVILKRPQPPWLPRRLRKHRQPQWVIWAPARFCSRKLCLNPNLLRNFISGERISTLLRGKRPFWHQHRHATGLPPPCPRFRPTKDCWTENHCHDGRLWTRRVHGRPRGRIQDVLPEILQEAGILPGHTRPRWGSNRSTWTNGRHGRHGRPSKHETGQVYSFQVHDRLYWQALAR